MRFFIRWVCYSFFALLFIGLLAFLSIFGGLYYFGRGLPDHNSLMNYNPSVSSTVYLKNGSVLKEFALEKRSFIDIEHIPEILKKAFLAAEDKNFYEHMGVDPMGIVRSILNNFINAGTSKRPQGASTITQQVARIFLIGTNELKYERKIREAILALRIEDALPKEKILELYLNQIYLGAGSYGVVAAAKCYFGKSIGELSIAECATLAALAKGATYYNPITHHDRAITRRNWVLKQMLHSNFITQSEYDIAINSDIEIAIGKDENIADYYAEEVRKEVIKKTPVDSVNRDGLIIYVPIDMNMQKAAERALKDGLERIDRAFNWRGPIGHVDYPSKTKGLENLKKVERIPGSEDFLKAIFVDDKNGGTLVTEDGDILSISKNDLSWIRTYNKKLSTGDVVLCTKSNKQAILKQVPQVQGAIVVMDPHSGRVLAMQGGYSFNMSKFNRVTQASRQPGSTFKPIVQLTALNSGYSPASIIDGSPITIQIGKTEWTPHNYGNAIVGSVTLRSTVERSLNTPTVRLAQNIGISNIAATSEKLGIYAHAPRVWSIVLGSVETTLIRLTNAYCIIANGGKKVTPIIIDQIQDRDGRTIYRSDHVDVDFISSVGYNVEKPPLFQNNLMQILDERSAYQMVSILTGVVENGTARRAKSLGIPLAGKTGTSNDSRDAWFIGFTPNLAVGVMVCFDNKNKSLGKKATGSSHALPIFIDFMKLAKQDKEKVPFQVPNGITFHYINRHTGHKCKVGDADSFLEAFKTEDHVNEIVVESIMNKQDQPIQDFGSSITLEADPLIGVY